MKRPTVSRREKRAVIGGVALIVTLVLSFKVLPAWTAWSVRVQEESRIAMARAAQVRLAVTLMKASRESLAVRASRLVTQNRLLIEGDSPSTAAANLASTVSLEAEEAGLLVNTIQPRVDSTRRTTGRVSVTLDATGDIAGLTDFLLAIEGGELLLAVRSLSVTQPEAGAPDDRMEALRLQLVVSGLMKSRTPTSARLD